MASPPPTRKDVNILGKQINRFLARLNRVEKGIMGVVFMVLTILVVTQVVMRKLGMQSFSWLEEVAQYSYVCAIFLGFSIGVTEDSHMKVSALDSKLPARVANVLHRVISVICAGASALLAKYTFETCAVMKKVNLKTAIVKLPIWVFYGFLGVCLSAMIVRFLLRAVFPAEAEEKEEGGDR